MRKEHYLKENSKMNIDELEELLEKHEIPYSWYYLYGPQYTKEQKTCIEKRGDTWSVYYFERGLESNVNNFNNENDACIELYNRMILEKASFDKLRREGKIK